MNNKMSCVHQIKVIFLSSALILIVLTQTAIQLHLTYNYNTKDGNVISDSESLSSSSSTVGNNRLRRSLVKIEKNDDENRGTLLKPKMTSPSPLVNTLTTSPMRPFPLLSTSSSTSFLKNSFKNNPHVTDWSDVNEELLLKNHYSGNFTLENGELCLRKPNATLIILVTSAIDHFEKRNSVRLTWGHYGLRDDVIYAFVIGDSLLPNYNSSVQERLKEEIEIYTDFVIGDFADTYRNLTLKTLHMLDWVSTFCTTAKYFIKTDDDVFLNVPKLLQFIQSVQEEDKLEPKIYGHVFSGHLPNRDVNHRHSVRYDVYPHNLTYPNFTSGPAYLMTTAILQPLLHEALSLPFLNLEDVLVNGFAAMNLGISRVDHPGFINEIQNPADLTACKLINILAGMTDGSSVQMNYVWFNYLMGKSICIWRTINDR